MNNDELFIELWNDYLEGEIDDSGLAQLRDLVDKDDRLLELATDAYQTHRLLGLIAEDSDTRHDDFVGETLACLPEKQDSFVDGVMQNLPQQGAKEVATRPRMIQWSAVTTAIAILVAIGLILFSPADGEILIATLASSENAAWESSLPTTPGSRLGRGVLNLRSGVATIRFASGAEIVLEAPSQLELVSAKQGKLLAGAAVINVPESAIGFVIETPEGFAVDHGTRFAVRVDEAGHQTDFEVLEGEIAVHFPQTGDEVRLTDFGQRATIANQSLSVVDSEVDDSDLEQWPDVIRIGTNGRAGSVRRDDKRPLNPEILSVRRTSMTERGLHSFFAFDLSSINLEQARTARLRLNLVPSKWGYARLPQVSEFAVYGLTERKRDDWAVESSWVDAPKPEDGVLLGRFEVPRSQRTGSFGIQNQELLDFLKALRDGPVTLILVRETEVDHVGHGLKHAFASDRHPEAVGPMLEFTMDDRP